MNSLDLNVRSTAKNKYLWTNDYIRTYIQLLHQADKDDERREGGIALIYINFLSVKCKIDAFQFSQFECIFCSEFRNNPTTSICVVSSCMYHLYGVHYSGHRGSNTFMSELSDFLLQYTLNIAKLNIVGDLNIHFHEAAT